MGHNGGTRSAERTNGFQSFGNADFIQEGSQQIMGSQIQVSCTTDLNHEAISPVPNSVDNQDQRGYKTS